jgi:dTDP-4-amino-4,6-dideoxygalactose transaminase
VTDLRTLERSIATRFGRRHCVLTGHGSTAIALALDMVGRERGKGEVLVPSVGCASIAQIIHYAGFTPRFVDINLDDYTVDVTALAAAVTPAARAIMPVHLFGHASDMNAIMALAQRNGLAVIEDAAQSLGGEHDGRMLGSIGDFGIFSFGGTKIVSAGGGGALLFDDHRYDAAVRSALDALPPYDYSLRAGLKSLSHRNLYHGAVDLLRADGGVRLESIFRTAMPEYRELYFHRFPENGAAGTLASALDDLDANLAARLERAEKYHQRLSRLPVQLSEKWASSRAVWRYTFMLRTPEETIRVTGQLRRNGIHASNHYWSLADLFDGEKNLPNTAVFCPRVLNLWVDDVATDAFIERTCHLIAESL